MCFLAIFIYVFCPVFDWIVCFFDIELHELFVYFGDQSFAVLFANISSYFEGYIFLLFTVSFVMQGLLSLMTSHWFSFVLIFITLARSKKILLWFMSMSF